MKSVSVAELRQNPTPALAAVAKGETVVVTRYRQEIARIVPPTRKAATGAEIMAMARRIRPDSTGWADELREQRDAADAEWRDPWAPR